MSYLYVVMKHIAPHNFSKNLLCKRIKSIIFTTDLKIVNKKNYEDF